MSLEDRIQLRTRNKLTTQQTNTLKPQIYEAEINSIEGKPIQLSDYKGRHLLLVNVASKCGFTRQYKSLQMLSEAYKDQLVVIGFPCNQFGGQEPGDASEILNFCEKRFGVKFPLTEKVKVKGADQHPIYQWLTKKSLNGRKNSSVHWNFQKYLVDPQGQLIDVFNSTTSPLSKKITRHLKE